MRNEPSGRSPKRSRRRRAGEERSYWQQYSDAAARIIFTAAIVLLLAVMASQAGLQSGAIRHFITGVDREEGTSVL
ncbi:hypothetical protein [Paenibacillus sp. NPDC058071]|uniref:hypothetical protein n=1 Tax=Paenibacillus sp. NPDC058071 TaxID=3346326 RepID=UPI0036D8EF55